MTPFMRIGLLVCMLLIAGIGVMLAATGSYGMAGVYVVLCWSNRPDVFRRRA